jgi:hypothetical protein
MHRYARAAGRGGVLCGAIVALGSLPVASQAPTGPLKSIFGTYGQLAAGRDSIQITEKVGGKVGMDLKLYYSNGHTCKLNKDGEWHVDHVAVVADGLDQNRPCRLNAFFEKGRILLKDDGLQCAPVYCGTRGTLDNVSLPKLNPNRK